MMAPVEIASCPVEVEVDEEVTPLNRNHPEVPLAKTATVVLSLESLSSVVSL